MLKKIILLLLLCAVCQPAFAQKITNPKTQLKPAELRIIPDKNMDDGTLLVLRDGKELLRFCIENKNSGRIFLMKPYSKDEETIKLSAEHIHPNTDYRDFVFDARGDGDCRYMIIGDFHLGTALSGIFGYLIDVKDDFKVVGGRFPIGEIFRLPRKNPDLIFQFCVSLMNYPWYVDIWVPLKLETGKFPVCVAQKRPVDLQKIKEEMNNDEYKHYYQDPEDLKLLRKYFFYLLYAEVVESGNYSQLRMHAKALGFSEKEINTFSKLTNEKVRESDLFRYLSLFNESDFER